MCEISPTKSLKFDSSIEIPEENLVLTSLAASDSTIAKTSLDYSKIAESVNIEDTMMVTEKNNKDRNLEKQDLLDNNCKQKSSRNSQKKAIRSASIHSESSITRQLYSTPTNRMFVILVVQNVFTIIYFIYLK